MSLWAQKLRSSQDDMCGQYTAHVRNCSTVFFLWLHFCALLVGLILAQNPELILVLVKKEH